MVESGVEKAKDIGTVAGYNRIMVRV